MRRAVAWLLVGCGLAASAAAQGVIPPAPRVIAAIAEGNLAAGRGTALRLELELVRGDGVVVGTGELLSDPSGRARLELRAPSGLVERHLVQGSRYQASRNGAPLEDPKRLLPPVPWLQAGKGAELETALRRSGVPAREIALGREDDRDCYVIGGRSPGGSPRTAPMRAALWVDLDDLAPVRIDRADGVRYRLGPAAAFGPLSVPGWIQVEVAGQPYLRLVVRDAQAIPPTSARFDPGWLAEPLPTRVPAPAPGPAAAGSETQ